MSYAEFALIRFGTGRSPRHDGPGSADALMQSLQDGDTVRRYPGLDVVAAGQLAKAVAQAQTALRKGQGSVEDDTRAKAALTAAVDGAARARLARAVDDPTGFADRLVQFWASHFSLRLSTAALRVLAASFQDELRRHQTGRFADLLRAATLHPAMLIYLDQTSSVGPNSIRAEKQKRRKIRVGLNENHARELLELHSMGAGAGYRQGDVRQLAKLMTGLFVDRDWQFVFDPRLAEPGAENVLGHAYGGGDPARLAEFTAFLDDLATRPETADFICTKLARHFCADDPPMRLIEDMKARYLASDGTLTEVYDMMVRHPLARESFGQKVRQPQDLLPAALRAMEVDGGQVMGWTDHEFQRSYVNALGRMGQSLRGAQQPEGWPEPAAAWLTPPMLSARIGWAMSQPKKLVERLPDPREFAAWALHPDVAADVAVAAGRAESRADGVGLVLASPQFNRR
ncbi:DUF1800 domain-containing protein [Paracoccus xiamenensis]|uniref:DUF1800 domain-containing protein n=1 Tax=Paracoccus xiamenensis TaxID=2714901 RepID=UPI00140BD9F8|nr:DUF1800 family protein [Paracoccus xiamenensis]NHF73709.1 DUF1800 domain-containing protein [Paracoccus xiamenensis]